MTYDLWRLLCLSMLLNIDMHFKQFVSINELETQQCTLKVAMAG